MNEYRTLAEKYLDKSWHGDVDKHHERAQVYALLAIAKELESLRLQQASGKDTTVDNR